MSRSQRSFTIVCCLSALLVGLLLAPTLWAQTLDKWTPGGGAPFGPPATANPDYEMGGNPAAKHGTDGGGFIRSIGAAPRMPAMLGTRVDAGAYQGKRVRLSAYVRTEGVVDDLMMTLGIVDQKKVVLAIGTGDPVRGTTGWTKQDIVLDVPPQSATLWCDVTLNGIGKIWLDGVTLEPVGRGVAVTPPKWIFGTRNEYDGGGDPLARHGSENGAFIRSKVPAPKMGAGLAMVATPVPYLGKRVRLSGYIKTENVEKATGLMMSLAGPNGELLSHDSMATRPIKGTTGWTKYDVVLDAPDTSCAMAYGILLQGAGSVWLDGLTLEVVSDDVPVTDTKGWFKSGSNPEDYAMGGYPAAPHGGRGGGFVRSAVPEPRTFGTWATVIDAQPHAGKRLRLSAFVRTEDVENWVGLWMRVDGPKGGLTFDNMENRAIRGTTDWRKYDVVLDVPPTAVRIMYGLILQGKGNASFDGLTLEPVDNTVALTGGPDAFSEYYAGNFAEAANRFRPRIAGTPISFSPRLFHYLSLHRSGQLEEARTYIVGVADGVVDKKWAAPVALFYAGRLSEDDVLKAAASADPTTDKQQKCEAYYYLGMAHLLKLGNVPGDEAARAATAQDYLAKCVATGVTNFVEYRAAQAELARLKK